VDTDRILSDEQPARAVAEHTEANRDAFFFLKSDDFARSEYRVLLATGDDDYACIDYGDSLAYVVVGERVPEWQDPAAIEACANTKISIRVGWMHWRAAARVSCRCARQDRPHLDPRRLRETMDLSRRRNTGRRLAPKFGNGRLWVVRRPLREGRYATEWLGRRGQRDGPGSRMLRPQKRRGHTWPLGAARRGASGRALCSPGELPAGRRAVLGGLGAPP
jgi:hypothetical protein